MRIMLQSSQYETLEEFIFNASEKLALQAERCASNLGILQQDYENYVVIKVEGYYNIARIIDEFTPIEIGENVYPFDEEKIYPMQGIELEFSYKR